VFLVLLIAGFLLLRAPGSGVGAQAMVGVGDAVNVLIGGSTKQLTL
jgi:hypothetical protein